MRLCAAIYADGFTAGVIMQVPPECILLLEERNTQIAMSEFVGVILVFIHFGHLMPTSSSIIFGDTMCVIAAIVAGGTRFRDLGTMTHRLHHKIAALGTTPWLEYVERWSNLSDGGTREELTHPVAKRLGISLKRLAPSVLPKSFPWVAPEERDSFWDSNSVVV